MTITFLTEEGFAEASERILSYDRSIGRPSNWRSYPKRWLYHSRSIEIIRSVATSPNEVLEMGTAGVQLVRDGDTIDYDKNWAFPGLNPTYLHDARQLPWPIEDRRYTIFVALRVFHHLHPVQRDCFLEAKRVADNILIVVPDPTPEKPHKGITVSQFTEWNEGRAPTLIESAGSYGFLYFWDAASLGRP